MVDQLVNAGVDVNFHTGNASPLTDALILDEPKISLILIRAGADVNARDESGNHPLYYAAGYPDEDMLITLKELVWWGADIHSRNIGGETPLHAACERDGAHSKVVEYLLQEGADANAVDDAGDTPLHYLRSFT